MTVSISRRLSDAFALNKEPHEYLSLRCVYSEQTRCSQATSGSHPEDGRLDNDVQEAA